MTREEKEREREKRDREMQEERREAARQREERYGQVRPFHGICPSSDIGWELIYRLRWTETVMLIDDVSGMIDHHLLDLLSTGGAPYLPDHQCLHLPLVDAGILRTTMVHPDHAEDQATEVMVQGDLHLLPPHPRIPSFNCLRRSTKNNDRYSSRRLHPG